MAEDNNARPAATTGARTSDAPEGNGPRTSGPGLTAQSRATGASARRVASNTALLGVVRLVERAVTFVVAVMVAAALGVGGLGEYATAFALYALLATAGDAGTTSYLVRELSRDRSRTGQYTVHLTLVGVVLSVLGVLAARGIVPHLGYSDELQRSVEIMLFAVAPRVLASIQAAVFVAHERVAFETVPRLVSALLYVAAAAVLLEGGHGVAALLTVFVVLEYVVAAVLILLIHVRIASLREPITWSTTVLLLRGMRAYTASTAIAALFARPEILILAALATERDAGLYSAAMRIAELPLLAADAFMVNVFTVLSNSYSTNEARFLQWQTASLRLLLGFSLPIAAFLFFGADSILELLFGTAFRPAAPVLQVLAVTLVMGCVNAVLWRSLAARGRQGRNVVVQLISLVVRLTASVPLTMAFGALGAACASAASVVLHAVLLAVAVRRSGAPPQVVRTSWRLALAAAAGGLSLWLADLLLPLLAALATASCAYVVAAVGLRAVTPSECRHALELLGRARGG